VGAVELVVHGVAQPYQVPQHHWRRCRQVRVRGSLGSRLQVLQRARVRGVRRIDRVLDRPPASLGHHVSFLGWLNFFGWAEQSRDRLTEPPFQYPGCRDARVGGAPGQPPFELALGHDESALTEAGGFLRKPAQHVALRQMSGVQFLFEPGARSVSMPREH
jgi:hypothetical protein